jgi:hypothetical protein
MFKLLKSTAGDCTVMLAAVEDGMEVTVTLLYWL